MPKFLKLQGKYLEEPPRKKINYEVEEDVVERISIDEAGGEGREGEEAVRQGMGMQRSVLK